MVIKYKDTRIVRNNVVSYTIGINKGRHSIFFYCTNGKYTELVSFKTKADAELVCNIIDLYPIDCGVVVSGVEYLVVDKEGNYVDDTTYTGFKPEYHYIDMTTPVCDIGKIIDVIGIEV